MLRALSWSGIVDQTRKRCLFYTALPHSALYPARPCAPNLWLVIISPRSTMASGSGRTGEYTETASPRTTPTNPSVCQYWPWNRETPSSMTHYPLVTPFREPRQNNRVEPRLFHPIHTGPLDNRANRHLARHLNTRGQSDMYSAVASAHNHQNKIIWVGIAGGRFFGAV